MNIRIPITPELRVRLAHTNCLVVELPPEISTALEGREELLKSLTAADVPTDSEALRVERDLLSAKCDEQAQRIRELERHNSKLQACGDAACLRLKEVTTELDGLKTQNANLKNYIVAITHADETGYVDGVGFVEDFSEIEDQVKAIVAAHDEEVAAKAIEDVANTLSKKNTVQPTYDKFIRTNELMQYAAQLRAKAGE